MTVNTARGDTAIGTLGPRRVRLLFRRVRMAIRRDPFAMGALAFLGLLVLVAVLGPLFAPYGPTEIIRTSQGKSQSSCRHHESIPSARHPSGATFSHR